MPAIHINSSRNSPSIRRLANLSLTILSSISPTSLPRWLRGKSPVYLAAEQSTSPLRKRPSTPQTCFRLNSQEKSSRYHTTRQTKTARSSLTAKAGWHLQRSEEHTSEL